MLKISLRNLSAHKLRLVLTLLSVILGTAFIAGSSMLTASMQNSFSDIFKSSLGSIDLVMEPKDKASQGLPVSVVEELRHSPDVSAVQPNADESSAIIAGPDKKPIQTGGAPSQAMPAAVDGKQVGDVAHMTAGVSPTAEGTAALNVEAADKAGIHVGDEVTMVSSAGRTTFKIVGLYKTDMAVGGFVGLMIPEKQYLDLFTDGEHISNVNIALKDKGQLDSIRASLEQKYPDAKFQTGSALADEANKQLKDQLAFINYFLWAFGGIALLVGSFIISNTFSMIITQRLREFALLRSLGAARTQITRSVVIEALLVGIVGSLLGIIAGAGLCRILVKIMDAQGMGIPDAGLALSTTSIVLPLAVGVVITVFSAWAPARRAGRVHPVQAMRSGDQSSSNSLFWRTAAGAVFILGGAAAAVFAGFNSEMGGTQTRAITVGVGAVAIILGTWLAGPALSIPFVGSIGRVVGAPFGAVGKLSATNSRRNPRRTAATAFALMLGLVMVSSIGMMGATMRENVNDMVDKTLGADLLVTVPPNMPVALPANVPDTLRGVEGVERVSTVSLAPILINQDAPPNPMMVDLQGVADGNIADIAEIEMVDGTSDLHGKEGIVIDKKTSEKQNVKVGDSLKLSSPDGRSVMAPVVGIFKDNQMVGAATTSQRTAEQLMSTQQIMLRNAGVIAKPGTDVAELKSKIEDATADDLIVIVQDREDLKGEAGQQISMMLNVLYALLALAVIIAILGIINTLALSVSERRQEIGMLRAVGFQRGQITRMINLEAIVIAFYGAVLGSVIGLGLGWAFIRCLSDLGLSTIAVPWAQVGLVVLAAGVVGWLASVVPARNAARTKPLEAIVE